MTMVRAGNREVVMRMHDDVDAQARMFWVIMAGLGAFLCVAGWLRLILG